MRFLYTLLFILTGFAYSQSMTKLNDGLDAIDKSSLPAEFQEMLDLFQQSHCQIIKEKEGDRLECKRGPFAGLIKDPNSETQNVLDEASRLTVPPTVEGGVDPTTDKSKKKIVNPDPSTTGR